MSENNPPPPPPPAPEPSNSGSPNPSSEPDVTKQVSDSLNQVFSGGGTGDCPAYGSGKMSAADDKLFCSLCHFFSWIIWLIKKDQSPAVEAHGKETTNFLITLIILFTVIAIVTQIPGVGCVTIFLFPIVGLGSFVLQIMGFIKAQDGKLFRYPVNLRLIK
jgi:uncharacterized protein